MEHGTLMVAVLSSKHLAGRKRDLDAILEELKEKKGPLSREKEHLFVAEEGVAIYVPFGFIAFAFALSEARPTLETAEQVLATKNGKRKPRRKKDDDVKYAHHIWIPLMSSLDKDNDAKTVNWCYSYLMGTQRVLKSSYTDQTAHSAWMSQLAEKAKASNQSSEAGTKSSENDSEEEAKSGD